MQARVLVLTLPTFVGLACSPSTETGEGTGGVGALAGGGGLGIGGTAHGGSGGQGGGAGDPLGGVAGVATSGASAGVAMSGTGGTGSGSSGMAGAVSGDAGSGGSTAGMGSGGGAGSAGLAGVGGAGGGGGGEDPSAAAEVLNGFALLKPCVSSFRPSGNANNAGDCCCEEIAANENQHITKQFGGDPNVTYDVTLRVAGVAERYWYSDGMLDPSMIFYRGGLPTIHSMSAPNTNLGPGQGACKVHPPETDGQFALPFSVPAEIRPSDGCYNGFNVFAMTVSSPKQSYYLNYTAEFDGNDRQPHSVYRTDYTVTIPIAGQARLDFYTIDGDHHQVTNNGTMSVPNVTTAQPFNGNFLEFSVIEVARAN